MIELSHRLRALTDWIDADCTADIGCDHAYAICQAVSEGRTKKGYACEVARGPLDRARKTITQEHLEDQVIPRLANGLESLPKDVSQAVIAGMGGRTMIEILKKAPARKMRFLLSPHSEEDVLRRWLLDHFYTITEERRIEEDGRFYPLMRVESHHPMALSPFEQLYGRNVRPDEEYLHFLQAEEQKWTHLLPNIPEPRHTFLQNRLRLIRQEIERIQSVLS